MGAVLKVQPVPVWHEGRALDVDVVAHERRGPVLEHGQVGRVHLELLEALRRAGLASDGSAVHHLDRPRESRRLPAGGQLELVAALAEGYAESALLAKAGLRRGGAVATRTSTVWRVCFR